jgi:hypothetical protein
MALYTTEMDACAIGCGEPYIFLKWIPGQSVFFWCPSCEAIWDEEILDEENLKPRLYSRDEFERHCLTFPSLSEIAAVWKHEVVTRTGTDEERFRECMRGFLGDRIRSPEPDD